MVLQVRNKTIKVIFEYYNEEKNSENIANIIMLQAIKQNVYEIICYDAAICKEFNKSTLFLYQRKKVKNSIISKIFNKTNFDEIIINYGDGDYCFT